MVKPLLVVATILAALASVYLYLVPFTNVIGMRLFADYKCADGGGVWSICGRVTPGSPDVAFAFLVFLIVQSTVGITVLGLLLYGCSRRNGHLTKFSAACFCCMREDDVTDEWVYDGGYIRGQAFCYDCSPCGCGSCSPCACGACLAYGGISMMVAGVVISTIFAGSWIGRAVAVKTIGVCIPYANTLIGVRGCVDVATNSYLNSVDCNNCVGIGFGLVALPALIVEVVLVALVGAVKACASGYMVIYKREKTAWMARDQFSIELPGAAPEIPGAAPVEPLDVSDFVATPTNPLPECAICYAGVRADCELPCHHLVCTGCAMRMKKCPVCSIPYKLGFLPHVATVVGPPSNSNELSL